MPPSPHTAADVAARDARAAERAPGLGRLRTAAAALERPRVATAGAALTVAAALGVLLARILPDVRGKPLFDDEVIAGLTALHPVRDVLDIVLSDRGGAPLHFVLAHATLALEPSYEALRWLSVIFAVATIPLCYDLGRRLGGRTAASVAALVAGASSMLAVYGSVGRMYALFAFASALAIDLFVRALERRTARAVAVAAVAAWLLPAVHPYGMVIVAIEALVALAVWRGRPLRPALPVLALVAVLAAGLVPFILADLRLSERFGVGVFERESVAPPEFAAGQLGEALAAFAGGAGWLALVFFGLALAGLFVTARARPAFGVFALATLAAVPILLVVVKAEDDLVTRLSPRHLMFGLPLWAALVGVGVARSVRDLPRGAAVLGVGAVAAAAVLAPPGITDPRNDASAERASVAAPAEWVRANVDDDAVLLFYSSLYLAALPETGEALAIPRSGRPLRMVERADYPVPSVLVAFPLDGTAIDGRRLTRRLGRDAEVGLFAEWVVVRVNGPFAEERAVLRAGRDALVALRASARKRSYAFVADVRGGLLTVCDALAELGDPCPDGVRPRALG